ncbi:MAG: GGDEF domain-containing protein [Clostridia bacterium]|nr:GGDEF domain-containing protein [Clostridia bacterium]
MSGLFIGVEAKLFCLLIVGFLFVFKLVFFNPSIRQRLSYIALFLGVVLSIVGDYILRLYTQMVFFGLCGICYAAAVFLLFEKESSLYLGIVSTGTAICTFCSMTLGYNAATYAVILALIIAFSVELYNKIRMDNLTKLYNRYAMDLELKEQLRQYKKEKTDSFYIIACDLDNFKYINDTWGHPEGDRALVLIADILSRVAKAFSSNVFRIGGDEFIIITESSEEGLAEEIEEAIKEELDCIDFRDDFNIEMSIGAALYDGATSIDNLLSAADKRLYEAKRN